MRAYKKAETHFIRNHIEPFLKDKGFKRYKAKDFVMVENGLVYAIYFGLSRWGSKSTYLYYSVHLLHDPDLSHSIDTYTVGNRLSDKEWRLDTHEQVDATYKSYIEALESKVLPWFKKINGHEKYMILLKNSNVKHTFQVAICEAMLGNIDRANIYLSEEALYQQQYNDYMTADELYASRVNFESYKKQVFNLKDAIAENDFDGWARIQSEQNLNFLKLI